VISVRDLRVELDRLILSKSIMRWLVTTKIDRRGLDFRGLTTSGAFARFGAKAAAADGPRN